MEHYRTNILDSWDWRITKVGLRQGATVTEFMAALPSYLLLGVEPAEDIKKFLAGYAKANIAGGKELEEFTAKVTAHLPDNFFDEPLAPDKERPTISDAVWLARTAVARLGLTANGENNCSNLDKLPLAV